MPASKVRLPWQFDAAGLRADVDALTPEDWVPHFSTRCYEGDWSGAALRSVGGEAGRLYPDPSVGAQFADTPLLARCPSAQAVLATFRCPLLAVRFLRLGPGSRIKEHTDLNLGFDDGEVRIHVPVATDPEPVKQSETSDQGFFCASFSMVGLLIHAAVGSFGGVGRRWRKRAGLAA